MRSWIFALITVFMLSVPVMAEEGTPVYATDLKNGSYTIDVESSSSMFRITDCVLNVNEGTMTAVMTLSGKGYEKLYMGTSQEAQNAGEEDYAYFKEDPEGKYTYTVTLEALDKEISCAAWSIRKEKWYDRTLVFKSDKLPQEAYKSSNKFAVIIAAVVVTVIAATVIFLKLKETKKLKMTE